MTTPYCPRWLYVEAIPYKFVSWALHASLCHDVILTVKRMSVRDYVCVCGCPWMHRPLLRKGYPMVDGHAAEWMIERMTENTPHSLSHPANADRIYPTGKGEKHEQKRRCTVRSAFKDGTACLHWRNGMP
ncbi:hypothetical protein [Parabacteroides merdae]|uniref:hypothetical protein n=1 Tax=Parabacteroides merdae TaxID=46503 RepID=UPI0022E52960|nr:hypothetical protein [Parabacteroides merdae]